MGVVGVVEVFLVVELVARDRWVGVRKSVLADIRRLRAPKSPLTTLRPRTLPSLVTCAKAAA